jgi:hypothetical protein
VTVPELAFEVEIVCMGIVLVPEGANPEIPAVAVAVQLKVAPAGLELKGTNAVEEPEQIVWVKGVLVKTGVSFMVKDFVAVVEEPHSLVTIKDTI